MGDAARCRRTIYFSFVLFRVSFFFPLRDIFSRTVIKLKLRCKPETQQRLSDTLAGVIHSDAIDYPPAAATREILENRLWHVFKGQAFSGGGEGGGR